MAKFRLNFHKQKRNKKSYIKKLVWRQQNILFKSGAQSRNQSAENKKDQLSLYIVDLRQWCALIDLSMPTMNLFKHSTRVAACLLFQNSNSSIQIRPITRLALFRDSGNVLSRRRFPFNLTRIQTLSSIPESEQS